LHPNIACVTSMDADHLDIYGDKKPLKNRLENLQIKFPIKPKCLRSKRIGFRRDDYCC
jgi:UDP-N-acetylmuramate--alanine ligase